jgi:hypothetical protein
MMRPAISVMCRLSRAPWWKCTGNSSSPTILAARGGDAARRERSEARRVDAAHLAGLAYQLPIAIDDEDALGVGVLHEPLRDGQDLAVILVVHHELRFVHRQVPR